MHHTRAGADARRHVPHATRGMRGRARLAPPSTPATPAAPARMHTQQGGARRTGGGGGAAASFDHDDRVDPAHGDDYGMGGRLQGSGGPGGMWKHDMYDGREQAAPRQPRLLQAASARGGTLV